MSATHYLILLGAVYLAPTLSRKHGLIAASACIAASLVAFILEMI